MASLVCIAVVGILCVSRAADIENFTVDHYEGGLYGSVSVKTDDWVVDQSLYSDCSGCVPDRKLYVKACSGTDCLLYYRHCDDADRPTACSYFFDDYPPIDVLAKTEADFQVAVSHVGLSSPADAHKSNFPLAALSTEGPGPYRFAPMLNYLRNPLNKGDSK